VEGDNGMRAQLRSVTCEAKDMLRQMSEEGDVRYQLVYPYTPSLLCESGNGLRCHWDYYDL